MAEEVSVRQKAPENVSKQSSGPSGPLISRVSFLLRHPVMRTAAYVCLCFLLTSTAWLAWEYHLMKMAAPQVSDLMTMGVGYLLQAAGILLYSWTLGKSQAAAEKLVPLALILHTLCLIPAILSTGFAGTLIPGLIMNLLCGFIAGDYLYALTKQVPARRRGLALGLGYGLSILASWLMSVVREGRIYYSSRVWIICLLLTALILLLLYLRQHMKAKDAEGQRAPVRAQGPGGQKPLYLAAGSVVLLFGVVSNCGFSFSSADLSLGISVESFRLFYAAGLLAAGLVTDRDRKTGAIAALSGLILPFVILALRGEQVSQTVFWALNYFVFGFYAVFRIIVFSDLAEKHSLFFLAGLGLMAGRTGDALGGSLSLLLRPSPTALVFVTALLFVAAVFLFFQIYRPLYAPEPVPQQTEAERFYQFCVRFDLSAREREVLRLLLQEKTNGEIGALLTISENTVKFHVRNLLQKTGCKNRNDLIALYVNP